MQDLVVAYERALMANGIRGWNLAQAMFILVGAFEPGGGGYNEPRFRVPHFAVRDYLDTVSPLALALARRLFDVKLRRILGVHEASDLLLCAAVANYLKVGDSVLGGLQAELNGLVWGTGVHEAAIAVALGDTSKQVAFATADGLRTVCGFDTGDMNSESGCAAAVAALALDAHGAMLHCWVSAAGQVCVCRGDSDAAQLLHSGGAPVTALSISSDGYLALGDHAGWVRVIDLASPGRVRLEASRNSPVLAVSVSVGGSGLAAAWADGCTKTGLGSKRAAELQGVSAAPISALAQCRVTERLAVGAADGVVSIVDLAQVRASRLHRASLLRAGPVAALAWGERGRVLAAASGLGVRVWDVDACAEGPEAAGKPLGPRFEARRDWIGRARRQIIELLRLDLLRDDAFNMLLPSGRRKFVVAASSRLAREALLFAGAVVARGPDSGDAIVELATAMPKPRDPAPPRASCDALLRGMTLAFLADLGPAAIQDGWPRRSVTEIAWPVDLEQEEFQAADQSASLEDADRDELASPPVVVQRDDAARDMVAGARDGIEPGQGTIPRGIGTLLNMRPHLHTYEPVLRRVLFHCEKTPAKITCGPAQVSAPEFFRLRFATQLWCYLDERAFGAAQRSDLVKMLERSFRPVRDPQTGDALKALATLGGKERWGASHDGLLGRLVDSCVPATAGSAANDRTIGLEPSRRLLQSIASVLGLREPPDIRTSSGCVKALFAVMEASVALPGGATGVREAAVTLELEMLHSSLLALLAAAPRSTLSSLREEQKALHAELTISVPQGAAARRLADLRVLVVVPASPASLNVTWLQNVRTAAGVAWRQYCASHGITQPTMLEARERRYAYIVLTLDQLVDEWKQARYEDLLADEPLVSRQKVMGFFTQLYAATQEAGKRTWARDEWEYLAHRLAHSGDAPVYADIYKRVAAASDPPSARGLAALYRFLRECTTVEAELSAAFLDCDCQESGRVP